MVMCHKLLELPITPRLQTHSHVLAASKGPPQRRLPKLLVMSGVGKAMKAMTKSRSIVDQLQCVKSCVGSFALLVNCHKIRLAQYRSRIKQQRLPGCQSCTETRSMPTPSLPTRPATSPVEIPIRLLEDAGREGEWGGRGTARFQRNPLEKSGFHKLGKCPQKSREVRWQCVLRIWR